MDPGAPRIAGGERSQQEEGTCEREAVLVGCRDSLPLRAGAEASRRGGCRLLGKMPGWRKWGERDWVKRQGEKRNPREIAPVLGFGAVRQRVGPHRATRISSVLSVGCVHAGMRI